MDRYPKFEKGEVDNIYSKLNPDDKKALDDFILSCRTSANENKVKDIKRCVLQFRHIVGKSFKDINLNELRHFLVLLNQSDREAWTKHDIKAHVKRFIKHNYEDWSKRFNGLKEMKKEATGMNEKKLNERTLLTKNEVETIMKKESDLPLKTFFISLYESGMRPKELRTLKWADIKFGSNGELSEISCFMTKTKKSKMVYVKEATFYLKKLQAQSDSDYIFSSRENKNLPISDATAHRWISLLGKHINKRMYPYLIRHSRSQELYEMVDEGKLSERVVQRYLGHGKSMRDIYSQLKQKTLKDAVTKTIYQFEELPTEKKHELEIKIDNLQKDNIKLQRSNTYMKKEIVEVKRLISSMRH